MIVEGQVHGGLAQGIGQALLEGCVYDTTAGQLAHRLATWTTRMPRADDLPQLQASTRTVTPCTHNPLGVKGCGEAGAIGSPAALINAAHRRARRARTSPMPATPQRVWRAANGKNA